MTDSSKKRDLIFRCRECGWRGAESEIIQIVDAELEGNRWNICPNPACRAAEQFENMCDEPGCNREATCGWPSPSGYRRTCGDHMRTLSPQNLRR